MHVFMRAQLHPLRISTHTKQTNNTHAHKQYTRTHANKYTHTHTHTHTLTHTLTHSHTHTLTHSHTHTLSHTILFPYCMRHGRLIKKMIKKNFIRRHALGKVSAAHEIAAAHQLTPVPERQR